MIKLDAIVKAVEGMTAGLNNLAKAINRAVDYLEKTKFVMPE